MEQPIYNVFELRVNASLNKIIKYHPGSRIYKSKGFKGEYKFTVPIQVKVIILDGEQVIHPDYRYADIIDRTIPIDGKKHENTLLVLVNHMIEMEWGAYISSFPSDNFDEFRHLSALVKELKILKSFKIPRPKMAFYSKIKGTERGGSNPNLDYDVEGMQVVIKNKYENIQIIDLLITNRINELNNHVHLIFPFTDLSYIKWTDKQIEQAFQQLQPTISKQRTPRLLFCRFVTETLLKYLRTEIQWPDQTSDISQDQGVLIYTLLALFNLIDPAHELKDTTAKLKAKRIRSFVRNDLSTKEEFPKIVRVREYKIPKPVSSGL